MKKSKVIVGAAVMLTVTIGVYLAYCYLQDKQPSSQFLVPAVLIQILYAANAYFRK